MSYFYRIPSNWRWVFEETFRGLEARDSSITYTPSDELPSKSLSLPRELTKPHAIFRFERREANGLIRAVWCSSSLLDHLNAKDSLYETFLRLSPDSIVTAMPHTQLLPWDTTHADAIDMSAPVILKASLGSAGYGLYYVETADDVIEILRNHADKARAEPHFLDNLIRDHGRVPYWSLQSLVDSVRVAGGEKCQFRVHVVMRGERLFMYDDVEVRITVWSEDDDNNDQGDDKPRDDSLMDFDNAMVGSGGGRPYNRNRDKRRTGRFLLEEVEGLRGLGLSGRIRELMHSSFETLRPSITERIDRQEAIPGLELTQLAVAGVDVMVDQDYRPWIIELNNPPAMPKLSADMSAGYRAHLLVMMERLMALGFGDNASNEEDNHKGFTQLW
jgi:hypothetical protein